MSGNQQKPTGGGPQTQRYAAALYQPMPPQQQRSDGFHVPTPPYVQSQQPNQPGSQAQTLRGLAPTGPPNQASTPPTNDLKVQPVPQQQSMNHMYVPPQQQVRGTQGPYYRSTAGPPSQTSRMPSQHRSQQQIYQTQAQYMQMPVPQMFISTASPMPYFSGQRPQTFVQTPVPVFGGQHFASSLSYSPNPNQTPAVPYSYFSHIPRTGHPPQAAALPPNPTQPLHNMPMAPAATQTTTFQRQPNKRRAKAIPIIDPDTGVDRLDEVYDQQNNSHPPSGESSARQTPQPAPHNPSKEVQAAFAKQVALAIGSDGSNPEEPEIQPGVVDHMETNVYHQPPSSRLEHIVQSSNLKAQAKEFVLNPNTPKEPPIVSANCDAVEVTLPNKQNKDRESPAKGRKQREQQQTIRDVQKDAVGVKDTTVVNTDSNVSNRDASNIFISNNDVNQSKDSVVPVNSVTPVASSVPIIVNKDIKELSHREDKKNQKKDIKSDAKVLSTDCNESASIPLNNLPVPPVQDVPTSAKNKNASQRTKDIQKQTPQTVVQKQQPLLAPVPVPQPQPAKANNKTNKKTELNQKGANKEGTDMDAFNDNAKLDAVNANLNTNSDLINANSVSNVTNNTTPQSTNIPVVNVNETSKKNSVNNGGDVTPIKMETVKTLPKGKIDITDIVKEKPKPIKMIPPQTESQDETDRVSSSNDKLVQAKNEANVKASCENNANITMIESKSDLPYSEDQWTPSNQNGKKVYERDFLLALRNNPASRKKPDNVPDIILADDRGRLSDGRYSMGGSRTDYTTPPFSYGGGKSGSQRGPPPKRNSQSGKVGGGGGKGSKAQVVKVSISVREEVKLHEVENAWKPARFLKSECMTDEEKKTEELYKKVRGVLNKLTPQKFETLVSQVRELQIDTEDRLQGVIDLVFEKAVDEPNFSVAYALMCRELALMQVPATPASNSTEDKKEFVNFRKLMVTRCQMEFEKQSFDETTRNEKVKEINECVDPEKRKELQFELGENDRRMRMKSVGNIRFIGELFKQQMLTVKIMMRCLNKLLEIKDEESLECLCKLLTTIGKELESKKIDLNQIFTIMKEIVDKKHGRVSSRVRFMLQDVIDLRRSKWMPRRQDSNPKTIDQIQKEAENEQLNSQVMSSVPMTPRKDDRGGSAGPNSDRKRRNVSDDGWTTTSRNSRTQFSVQSDKLKNKPPLTDEPLGSRLMFGNWSKGSNIKTEPPVSTNTANMYAALENIDPEKRPPGARPSSKDPYNSKGPSLERGTYKQSYDGRGSRSGSQPRSNEPVSITHNQKTAVAVTLPSTPKPMQPPAPVSKLTEEQLERRVNNNLIEYLNDSCTIEEYNDDTRTVVPSSYLARVVADGYLHVLERSMTARVRTGMLFAKLINLGTLPLAEYCMGVEEILRQADDLTIDIPLIWDYLAEILVHLICEEALPLNRLHKSCELLISQGHGARLLASLFKLVVSEKGPNFLLNCWQASGLTLVDFMPQSQVDAFIKVNKLEFLCGGNTAAGQAQLTYEQIYKKLLEFFNSKTSFDDIVNWITANVGEHVKENKFIRTLATAIFDNSIARQKLVVETLQGHYKLLLKYVDNNSNYELQCLFALQALIHKLEHPKGLLLSICDRLYEESTFSQESFIAWEVNGDPAEQEGKGVALKQLTSFFTQLKENEEEEEEEYEGSTGSEEA